MLDDTICPPRVITSRQSIWISMGIWVRFGWTIFFLGLSTWVPISDSDHYFFLWEDCISICIVNNVRNFDPKHWDQAKKDMAEPKVKEKPGGQGGTYQTVPLESLSHLSLTIPK